ncbi:MAG TPA: hypothetical protein GX006_07975 [Clostridiales bacterium]|nr:hypothetical protein [Clostridiales bacterium]
MDQEQHSLKKAVSLETFVFLILFFGVFTYIAVVMGFVNALSTFMQTAYHLLVDTVLFLAAIAVLAGAISGLLAEFGVIALIDRLLTPLMKPLFGMPGAASIGAITTYMSDNPAILALAADKNYRCYFKKYQVPALTNLGTGFGMGAIITTFMMGLSTLTGQNFLPAALVGNLGALVGSIISTRIMLRFTKRMYGTQEAAMDDCGVPLDRNYRIVRKGSLASRFLEAMLDGGKVGVQMGVDIVPGVLIICTFVMVLTGGPSASGQFTGAAYEGVGLLPRVGEALQFILRPMFGLQSAQGIAVPITALGSSGASLSIVSRLVTEGLANPHDVAVFTSMCMCFSGYLSTHVAMMNTLGFSHITGKAILSHTVGGLAAGVFAHWAYTLIMLL